MVANAYVYCIDTHKLRPLLTLAQDASILFGLSHICPSQKGEKEFRPSFKHMPIEEHYCNLIVHMLNTAQFVPSKKYCAVKAAHSLSAF